MKLKYKYTDESKRLSCGHGACNCMANVKATFTLNDVFYAEIWLCNSHLTEFRRLLHEDESE